ncbi:hypothetical protein [Agrobacterium tumefaciens]|uniref:hypothetical protein n=1 Tax=Agrobacterium tumefaciens TaxID=358 RepID=UPI001F3ADDF4|nr:hypothetical protein [Agrobacterium tumefaciens]WCK74443.1 hypothetical protein G6L96_026755 [Agrobacterium tumefaciens]
MAANANSSLGQNGAYQEGSLRTLFQTAARHSDQRHLCTACVDIPRPCTGALLAYLALKGLKFLEYLDFHHFPREERDKLLREINWLVTTQPGEKDLPDIAAG